MKRDSAGAGKAYFLASVMVVLCVLGQALITQLGFGSVTVYQFYIAAMAVFMLVPSIRLSNGASVDVFRLESPGWRVALLCVFAAAVAAFMNAHLGNIIYEALARAGLKPASASVPREADAVKFMAYVFFAVVMTGLCEEIVMRGVVLSSFEHRGSWRAIIISAGLFALLHGRVESFVQSFAVGVMLGFVFVASNSLVASVVLHMAYNATVIALSFLPEEWADALFGGGVWHSAICVCLSAAIIAGALAAVRALGEGEFLAAESAGEEENDVDGIILLSAGAATMVCVAALNLAQGLVGR